MGKRSRKRRPDGSPLASSPATEAEAVDGLPAEDEPAPTRSERTERRNAEIRANLEPLAEGERPGAMTVAAVVAFLLAIGNLVALAVGLEVRGETVSPPGVIALAVILLVAAGGLWQRKYWAVLGFQALLALTLVYAGLSLMVATGWQGVLLCVVILGLAGTLFWKLIRAMARIQMPKYER